MLKELVKERLMAATEEILALFERTVASYEEELSRTREEKERHRRQLEAVYKTQNVLPSEDVQQLIGLQEEHSRQPPQPQVWISSFKQENAQVLHVKEEEEELWTTQGGECLLGLQEADITTLPLTLVSVKTEDHEDKPFESSQLHQSPSEGNRGPEPPSSNSRSPQHMKTKADKDHYGGSQADKRLALLSDSKHTPSHSQLIGLQEERDLQLQRWISTLKQEDSQLLHVKEEELWTTQERECLLGSEEADLIKLSLTNVSVKIEDHENKPPEPSQLHHSLSVENRGAEPPSISSSSPEHTTEADGDHCGGSQADKLLTPLSDSENTPPHSPEDEDRDHTQEAFSSDTDYEGVLRTHTDNRHSECSKKKMVKKRFTCSICAKCFSSKSLLTRHMRTHTGEKPFRCSVCSRGFSQKSKIAEHMRTHTGEKPFRCSVCGREFSQKSKMTLHLRTHTGEKPFRCSVCSQGFSSKSNMAAHMRAHTGEKPFMCSICGQGFSFKTNMVAHMRTHTREKPFNCSVCERKFAQRSTLMRHMRTHTGEKLFSCSVCSQGFSQKSNMAAHMRTHTGE